jgi:hypothetical protein
LEIDLFAEDRAHEQFLRPLIERMVREHGRHATIRVRSARGGHGRAIEELKLYQKALIGGAIVDPMPAIIVVAIDANCRRFSQARDEVRSALSDHFRSSVVIACPDPHIERWYLADLKSFKSVVGVTPTLGHKKCKRDVYKQLLAKVVVDAGHPPTLGGLEFARELAMNLDYYRAQRSEQSLKHFLRDLRAMLAPVGAPGGCGK